MNPLEGKNIKDVKKTLEKVFGQMNEQTRKLADEMLKIHRPKEKKDIEINGKKCSISLTEDGRVFIQFPDIKSSEEYYEMPPIHSESALMGWRIQEKQNGKIEGKKEGWAEGVKDANNNWMSWSWIDRIFYKSKIKT